EVDVSVVRPDVETLRLLQLQHLLHVPFENLDIHWERPIALDTDRFYEKIVINGRGGFCYELNGLFNELLIEIGFHTHLVSGRVYGPDKVPGPEFDHMAIVVLVGNDEYLADVGFGDFAAEPLKIDPSGEQADREGVFFVRFTEHGAFEIEKFKEGQWIPELLFGRNGHSLSEFAERNEFQQHSPDSHFTKGKICSILTADGRKTLTDGKFIVTSNGEKTESSINSNEEFEAILQGEFGIRRDK
ncbi:MAG: arylamine N-acetyltransferase, partial [Acidobacteriota bacterium]